MEKSAPVTLPVLSLASSSARSATSSGRVKRPVTVPAAACAATSPGGAGSGDHCGAFVDQRPGDRPADPFTGAGDDGDLATQMQVHPLLLTFAVQSESRCALDLQPEHGLGT
jgi:hypothetical protein